MDPLNPIHKLLPVITYIRAAADEHSFTSVFPASKSVKLLKGKVPEVLTMETPYANKDVNKNELLL